MPAQLSSLMLPGRKSDYNLWVRVQAVVLRVFDQYITLMRKVQTTYWCALTF